MLGAGFESFWLGERLLKMWALYNSSTNQAHNGYIEIYLNLGWLGLIVLLGVLVTGYRNLVAGLRSQSAASALGMAYFVVAVAYNCTEGGFKMMHPAWIALLLAVSRVPEVAALITDRRPVSPSPYWARAVSPAHTRTYPPVGDGLGSGRNGSTNVYGAPRHRRRLGGPPQEWRRK
jgi:hypothetical protein